MNNSLEVLPVNTRIKLSGLWAAAVLCYIYGDYFELYVPGKLPSMLRGEIVPLGSVAPGVLLGTSVMMAIPSVMVALTLLLRPGIVEMLLTLSIAYLAWKWPKAGIAIVDKAWTQ